MSMIMTKSMRTVLYWYVNNATNIDDDDDDDDDD